jgi:hypothetical protein
MAGSWGASWLSYWKSSWGYGATPSPTSTDTHDLLPEDYKRHRARLLRQARAAEKALYRNVPAARKVKEMAVDMREHLLPSKHVAKPEIIPQPVIIYDMDKMPLANPLQWLLDDDEEAIAWLM